MSIKFLRFWCSFLFPEDVEFINAYPQKNKNKKQHNCVLMINFLCVFKMNEGEL